MPEKQSQEFDPMAAKEHYKSLQMFSETRSKEMNQMFLPFIDITDRYGLLISRVTLVLGNIKPKDTQDTVLRDLMTDVFDCLYESRSLIIGAKINVAFPVVRRAYESLTLLNLCAINRSLADRWQKGKEITNGEVRKELDKHPLGESKEDMEKLYQFYCLGSHPNRELIPRRFLGEGNQFVLGAIGKPNLWLACDLCIKILEMWFWLTAMVSVIYHEVLSKIDTTYNEAYILTATDAKEISKWLVENFNKVLKEEQEHWINNPVKD